MKKFLLSLSMLLLFAGCGTNNLVVKNDNSLVFNFADKKSILASEVVESKTLRFSTLSVEQSILKDDNNRILFYEDVALDDDYIFRYNMLNSVDYIFNARKNTVIYDDNTVLLVQIELPEGEFLNVLAYSNSVLNLSYVYGFSNYEFKKIAGELTKERDARVPSLRKQGIGLRRDDMPLSRWSVTKLIVNPFTTLFKGQKVF